jgi:hypothetical protein
LCGYFSLASTLTLTNSHLSIAGSFTIEAGHQLRLIESTISITHHCAFGDSITGGVRETDTVQFAMKNRIHGFDRRNGLD